MTTQFDPLQKRTAIWPERKRLQNVIGKEHFWYRFGIVRVSHNLDISVLISFCTSDWY